jgi:hypothetical protein
LVVDFLPIEFVLKSTLKCTCPIRVIMNLNGLFVYGRGVSQVKQ